ncbi:MAG TPA: hypothetical protein VEW74_10450 [Candidatus Nitrosotalea sp.]|nr:hypothetical protein [Candidatus Nitrosotalea sp.]
MLLPTAEPWRKVSSQRARTWVLGVAIAVVSGCTHKPDAAGQVSAALGPFTATRGQAVALVAAQKRSLGPADLNTLSVLYTALQAKANAYAGFIVEGVTASSFDDSRNERYADELSHAIAAFDHGFAGIAASKQDALSQAWVPSFSASLHAKWSQYQPLQARLSAQQNLNLVAQIKRDTVWPNFEDIATESLR